MKFVCDSCQAQYLIADEKVGAKGVKVKCKKCGHVIVIRPGGETGPSSKRSSSQTKMPVLAPLPPPAATPPPPPSDMVNDDRDAATSINIPRPSLSDLGVKSKDAPPIHDEPTGDEVPGGAPMASFPEKPALQEEQMTTPGLAAQGFGGPEAEASSPTLAAPPSAEVLHAISKHRIHANDNATSVSPPPAPPAESFPAPAEEAAAAGAAPGNDLENELAGAFDGLFAGGGQGVDDRAPTKVVNTDQMDAIREAVQERKAEKSERSKVNGSAAPAPGAEQPKKRVERIADRQQEKQEKAEKADQAEKAPIEWYAAINDEQKGPFTLDEIETHWIKGNVDREALVWRTGMPDWTPLKDVKELKYLMDLAPQKKAAAAPSPANDVAASALAPAPSVGMDAGALAALGLAAADDESEEAWRPRGMTGVYRAASAAEASAVSSEPSEPGPLPAADEPSWSPGAASALASLVDDELDALSSKKSSAAKRKNEAPFKPPPAEDDSIEAPLPAVLSSLPPVSQASFSLPPSAVPALSQVAMPALPMQQTSMPFGTPLQQKSSMSPLVIIGAAGGVLSLVAVVALVVMVAAGVGPFGRGDNKGAQVAQADPQPTPAQQQPAADPPPAQQQGTTPPPTEQQATPPPAQQQPAAAAAEPPKQEEKKADTKPERSDAKAGGSADRREREEQRRKDREEREEARRRDREEKEAARRRAKEEADAKRNSFAGKVEDEPEKPKKKSSSDCDPILYPEGCEDKPKSTPKAAGKETLSKADILGVVKRNKGDISRCVAEQRKRDPGKAGGVIKMSWVIKQDGHTSDVGVETAEFANEYVGKCLTRAIQGWKFPTYSGSQPPPIKFPFKMEQF